MDSSERGEGGRQHLRLDSARNAATIFLPASERRDRFKERWKGILLVKDCSSMVEKDSNASSSRSGAKGAPLFATTVTSVERGSCVSIFASDATVGT